METPLEKLTSEVLKLTTSERAALVEVLLESLEDDSDIDEAWAIEVAQRSRDVEKGITQAIPLSDALAQVRTNLK